MMKLRSELAECRILRERILADPVLAAERLFGFVCWSEAQRELIRAPFFHRKTIFWSGHAGGKSQTYEVLPWLWLMSRETPSGFVMVTSGTWDMLAKKLLPLMRQGAARCVVPMGVEVTSEGCMLGPDYGIVALSPKAATTFQGWHTAGGNLCMADEATRDDFTSVVALAMSSSASGDRDAMVWTCNPLTLDGPARDAAFSPDWHKIQWSALESPNVIAGREVFPGLCSRHFVDEIRREYGVESYEYVTHVLGEWPSETPETLISLREVEKMAARPIPAVDSRGLVMGVDVALSPVGDDTVIVVRDGGGIRYRAGRKGMGPLTVGDWVCDVIREFRPSREDFRFRVHVDNSGGYGGGVTEYLERKADEWNLLVRGFSAASRANDAEGFVNCRAEMYWRMKLGIEGGLAASRADMEVFKAEAGIRKVHRNDRMGVELKPDFKARIGRSPDNLDALALTYAEELGAAVLSPELFNDVHSMNAEPRIEMVDGNARLWVSGYVNERGEDRMREVDLVRAVVQVPGVAFGCVCAAVDSDGDWTVYRAFRRMGVYGSEVFGELARQCAGESYKQEVLDCGRGWKRGAVNGTIPPYEPIVSWTDSAGGRPFRRLFPVESGMDGEGLDVLNGMFRATLAACDPGADFFRDSGVSEEEKAMMGKRGGIFFAKSCAAALEECRDAMFRPAQSLAGSDDARLKADRLVLFGALRLACRV